MGSCAIIGESEFGAIAQLGARLTGSQEVRSSILLRSTKKISLPLGRDIFLV